MSKFHNNGANLASDDPFVLLQEPSQDKYPAGRAIAAAYWISYFTLHWLTILKVVEPTTTIAGTTIYFLLSAIIATMTLAAHELAVAKEKGK